MRESMPDLVSRPRKRVQLMAEINVVPYIDVMLVLLIIFMVTAPLLVKGVTVELPRAVAKHLSTRQQPVVVTVDKQGLYYVNLDHNPTQPQSKHRLLHTVRGLMAEQSGGNAAFQVYVKADKQVDYGKVMTLMAMMQQLGIQHIGLMAESEKTVQTAPPANRHLTSS